MEQAVALNAWGSRMRLKMPWWFWNLFGEQAVFLAEPARLTSMIRKCGCRFSKAIILTLALAKFLLSNVFALLLRRAADDAGP